MQMTMIMTYANNIIDKTYLSTDNDKGNDKTKI